jgi:hypothetical protein
LEIFEIFAPTFFFFSNRLKPKQCFAGALFRGYITLDEENPKKTIVDKTPCNQVRKHNKPDLCANI